MFSLLHSEPVTGQNSLGQVNNTTTEAGEKPKAKEPAGPCALWGLQGMLLPALRASVGAWPSWASMACG